MDTMASTGQGWSVGPGTFVGLSHSHLGVKTQIFGPFSAAYPRSIAASYIISGTGSVHIGITPVAVMFYIQNISPNVSHWINNAVFHSLTMFQVLPYNKFTGIIRINHFGQISLGNFSPGFAEKWTKLFTRCSSFNFRENHQDNFQNSHGHWKN